MIDLRKKTLLDIFLLGRFVVKVGKKIDKDKTILFIILALVDEKPRTIQELAKLLTVNHSFMSAMITKLEKKGFVKKKIYKDQRYRQVVLAEGGKMLRKQVADEGYKIADILLKGFTDEEIVQLDKLIVKLNKDYEELTANIDLDYTTLRK